MFLRLTPSQHKLQDTPVARYLRTKCRDANIFTYWHLHRHVWVCATWVHRTGGVCNEAFIWKGGPHDCPPDKIESFIFQRSPQYMAFLQEMRNKARLYEKTMEDEAISFAEEQAELFDFEKRHARATLQDHWSWWTFVKQDRRAG